MRCVYNTVLSFFSPHSAQNLAPARAIFDRIRNRDLYKCVDYKLVKWDDKRLFEERVTSADIITMAREDFRIRSEPGNDLKIAVVSSTEEGNDDEDEHITRESHPPLDPSMLTEDDVIVSLAPMHYGMGNENPLAKVKFYSKSKLNGEWRLKTSNITMPLMRCT